MELEVTAEGGIPPYEILWSDGTSANPISLGLSPGVQGVTITDNNNCSVDTLFRISALTSDYQMFFLPTMIKLMILVL